MEGYARILFKGYPIPSAGYQSPGGAAAGGGRQWKMTDAGSALRSVIRVLFQQFHSACSP